MRFRLPVICCFPLSAPWILIETINLCHQPKPISRLPVKWEAKGKTFYLKHFWICLCCFLYKKLAKEQTCGTQWCKERDKLREDHGNIYITICKIDSQWELAVWLKELKLELCNILEGWGGAGWREVQEGGEICIPETDSCWCMAETNTIL